ncbi:glycosyl transferase [Arcticibacter svalbardensis MN12-7]|uniref:Glycosyl transferase n=1 Tax=Arcticibacter svalbardensis MN12-7 TaxID=1150600 RepID=R9GYN0_9SPHI|nr:glycosyltransferase family 2 protein [Arcticibacter svalbardensis]EOR94079.1 glycosyl transferase [Arcticibacter svalbardensis MN12-7]
MENFPLVSIVTPSFNQGAYIERTILSVLNQTYKNIQYLVIDGGSNDSTMEIVNKYKSQIDVVISERDKGQSDAINKGFKLSKGELVGWINSDDILYPDAIQIVVDSYMSNLDASVIMPTKVDWIDEVDHIIKQREIKGRSKFDLINNDFNIVQQGSFYKKEAVVKANYCNELLYYCMDLDLIIRLSDYGNIHFINESIAGFRMHKDTKTLNGHNKFYNEIWGVLKMNNVSISSGNSIRLHKAKFKNIIKNALGIH